MVSERFKLPIDFSPESVSNPDNKICIVSFIGKHRLSNHLTKVTRLNEVIGSDVFQECLENGGDCEIEGYYDAERRVIYLHLQSVYDASTLAYLCQQTSIDIAKKGTDDILQKAEHRYAKCLLFLFSVSHLMVIVHPGSSFDIAYVRLFRVLDTLRLKLQNAVCEHLKALRAGKDWYLAGRPCSPRTLFIFDSCSLRPADIAADQANKTKSHKLSAVKRLQHAIEDQIYRILRKSRVITNISNNSLFAVPANQEFVYICPPQEKHSDLVGFYLDQLKHNCSAARDADTPRTKSYQNNRRGNQPRAGSRPPAPQPEEGLSDFLFQHIDMALSSKGIDDNVGRNPVQAMFYLPTSEIWFKTSDVLYRMFMKEQADSKARPHFNTLYSMLDINHRFSEGRCAKILPMAETAYQEGLPQHYTKSYHTKKLQQAKRVFLQHARGPACDKYLAQLEEACEDLWRSGRQLCEQVSITGNHCINQLHRLESDKDESKALLPVMPHVSQVKTRGTCNCGNKQMDREDPFTHKAANNEFFRILALNCCNTLESYELPVFKASISEARAHDFRNTTSGSATVLSSKASSGGENISPVMGRRELTSDGRPLSLALSLDNSGSGDVFQRQHHLNHHHNLSDVEDHSDSDSQASFNPDASQQNAVNAPVDLAEDHDVITTTSGAAVVDPDIVADVEHADGDSVVSRQQSTTEYISTMITSDTPPGLLPRFSSWSLLCHGKPQLYIPSQGVDQPNFSHQCNFLLPWDVTVKADQERWPPVHETSKKVKQFRRTSMAVDYTVRVYIGFEYECPRGHRFFLSGPDKIFKAPPNGIFKETAGKVLHNNMPMYYPCNCRSSKGYMGQLMRVHMVAPEGAIIELRARIRPGPEPCPFFFPGLDTPIVLPHEGWWILRFPYVYVGEKGVYTMPKEAGKVIQCHVQKNIMRIINET